MARIGMVNFINTAPIYEVWKEEVREPEWLVTEAPPTTLNKLLANGQLDLGFVSSCEYAHRPEMYQILGDLSISANGPVGSVFLFSHHSLQDLESEIVLLTGQSDTSVCLVKIILEEFYQVQPQYIVGDVFHDQQFDHEIAAVLAIGDEALRLKSEGNYPFQLDLAEIWKSHTGLPFVFAVCAVREDFIKSSSKTARDIHQRFLDCRMQGHQRLFEICQRVAPRIPMNTEACYSYLKAMEYDLDAEKQKGLEKFFTYLIMRGEASNNALPLKIFS